MHAFVTGGSGFIGSHLIGALLRRGWEVRVLVHRTPIRQEGQVEAVRGDIGEVELLKRALSGIDVVFHLASVVGSSKTQRNEFFRVNAGGTDALLRAAGEARAGRIVHCSSAGVLGKVKKGEIADESYPPRPLLDYDRAKLEAERAALSFSRSGMDVVVVRPGWTYGPGDRRTFKLIKQIHDRRFILPGRGDGLQTPVFIDDLVAGLLAASERGKSGTVYHLAGPETLTAEEMVRMIAAACGRRIPRLRLPLFLAASSAFVLEKAFRLFGQEPPLSRAKLSFFTHSKPLSTARARTELDFRPATAFQDGIRQTVAWYRDRDWL